MVLRLLYLATSAALFLGCAETDWNSNPIGNGNGDGGDGNPAINLYCDYGPETQYGGGCFPAQSESECDTQWGWAVSVCGLYCDWGPITQWGGGCSPIENASVCKPSDGGSIVNFCSR